MGAGPGETPEALKRCRTDGEAEEERKGRAWQEEGLAGYHTQREGLMGREVQRKIHSGVGRTIKGGKDA